MRQAHWKDTRYTLDGIECGRVAGHQSSRAGRAGARRRRVGVIFCGASIGHTPVQLVVAPARVTQLPKQHQHLRHLALRAGTSSCGTSRPGNPLPFGMEQVQHNHSIRSPSVAGHLEGHCGFAAIGGEHDGAWTMLRPCGMDTQRGLAHGTHGAAGGRQASVA
jgi:hypothetical protein